VNKLNMNKTQGLGFGTDEEEAPKKPQAAASAGFVKANSQTMAATPHHPGMPFSAFQILFY